MDRSVHMHHGAPSGVAASPNTRQLTNRHWPDAFGFGLWGTGPCFVISVEKGSVAHKAGILPGDQLLEIDGHDVANMSIDAVKTLARHSATVPPTVGVVTRLQHLEIVPNRQLGYGFTVSGSKPVVVQSINPFGPGYQSGVREGDLVLEVNGHYVRTCEAVQTLLASHYGKMVLGILAFEKAVGTENQLGVPLNDVRMKSPGSRVKKARDLFGKMNDMLGRDYEKKMAVVGVLKQYAEDRNVERLSRALALLLNSSKHRRLIKEVRPFIPVKHRNMFDTILDNDPNSTDLSSNDQTASLRVKSRSRTPDLTQGDIKTVTVDRKDGSFGFILRGSNPVYIESVDINGAADRAGLKAGHCILRLNGLDVRKCGHAHLVKLLQGSGNRPTFEVMKMVDREGIPIRPGSAASSDTASTSSYDESSSWLKETSRIVDKDGRTFKQRADHLLTKREKDNLRRSLTRYNNTRDVATFFDDVTRVFDTPSKTTLWMFLIPKLTNEHRDYCLQRINVPRELLLDVYPLDQRSRLRQSAKKSPATNEDEEIEERNPFLLSIPGDTPLDRDRGSISSHGSGGSSMSWMADVREMNHVGSFKQQLEYLLTSRERLELKNALQIYTRNRSVDNLIEDASVILDTPSKRTLWLYIIPLLPDEHQEVCRATLSIPVNLVNPAVQGGITSSYTSDSEPSQSQSMSECSSVSEENNITNFKPAHPQDGDVMFHSEDDFNFIGKAAALLKGDAGDRLSLGSSEDIHSLRSYQYSPHSPSYGSRFWRSTPSLAHVDEPKIQPSNSQNQNRSLVSPTSPRVNGHGDQLLSIDDNFLLQAPRNGTLSQHDLDLPRPISSYRVQEIDEDDPRLEDILPQGVRDVEGKVVIVQTNIPPQPHHGPLMSTHINPVHSPAHHIHSPVHQNVQSPIHGQNVMYLPNSQSPKTSHIGSLSPTSSVSHAYSLQSSPQQSSHTSPYHSPHHQSPLPVHSHQSTPVHARFNMGSPSHGDHSQDSPYISAHPHHILPEDGANMNSQNSPYHGGHPSNGSNQNLPYNVHTYNEHPLSRQDQSHPSGPYESYPYHPPPFPLPEHKGDDTCPQCGSHPKQIHPTNGAKASSAGSDVKSLLSSQDSFIEKAKDAIQALDDAVAAESDDDSNDSQKDTIRGNVPMPPPPPPLPPVPPPLPKHLKSEQKENYPMYVKRLNWEKLDISDMKETVWGQLGDTGYLQDVVKYLELEHKFSTKRTEIVSKATRVNKNQVNILNAKKAYNTSILLGHLKMSVSDLKNALYRMDEEIFTPELIQQMLAYAPNEEEIEKYDHYNGLTGDLSKPDQFCFEMSRMPGYTQKLKAMLFKANFAEKVEELKETLNCIKRASQELLGSKKLKKMIEMVLAMGNYMNKGNSRIGEASAFKITYLSQLDTTKTTDGKATFLHVLSKGFIKRFPEITTLRDELPSIASASKVRYCPRVNSVTGTRMPDFCISTMTIVKGKIRMTSDSIAQELNDLKKVLQEISNNVNKYNAFNAVVKDRFQEVMGFFISIASDEIQGLYAMQTLTVAEFHTMLKYFGEDPDSSTANDIFKIFADFLAKFERAHQENLMHERHH
ncbi:delphilin-like isoform X3 [Lineus longissimus]|uniref:delphilin-like isoform X3 n=1 Tax=Lineus longissimus TaxID=88925 RepID=UPI00315D5B2C